MAEFYQISDGGIRDKMEEECGIFGIYDPLGGNNAVELCYLGLHALQHRGQESAGICVNDQGSFKLHKDMGLVTNVFNDDLLHSLNGEMAIGHVRYSTTGSSLLVNAQPLLINSYKGYLALAHNGNLVNGVELRAKLESQGSIFHTTLDTEVIAHLTARSFADDITAALSHSLYQLKGAYSIVAMTADSLIAARDPYGFRPLSLGKLADSWVISSESCAFEMIGAEFIRDVGRGEMIVINKDGLQSFNFSEEKPYNFCIFEFIYFARPDSAFGGQNVHLARKEMGRQLAREMEKDADLVVPVPSSGIDAALGLAEEAQLPYDNGILRNRYVGRTFIQPTQEIRDLKVRLKLSPIKEIIQGKKLILVDDSLVRGTTSRQIVSRLREAGAAEIHLAICSPPVLYPCFYGLDTARRQELLARKKSREDIARYVKADSLTYLSLEGLLNSIKAPEYGFCTACLSGRYPLKGASIKEDIDGSNL